MHAELWGFDEETYSWFERFSMAELRAYWYTTVDATLLSPEDVHRLSFFVPDRVVAHALLHVTRSTHSFTRTQLRTLESMLFADEPFDFDKFFNRLPAGLRLVFRSPQLFAEPYGRFMRKAFAFVRDTHLPNLCAAWPISRAPQELRLPGCVDEPLKVLKRL